MREIKIFYFNKPNNSTHAHTSQVAVKESQFKIILIWSRTGPHVRTCVCACVYMIIIDN